MDRSITLYFYPSPFGVDWRSPRHLAISTIRNALSLKPRMIGHVSIEISEPSHENKEKLNLYESIPFLFTGMSTKHFKQNKKLLIWDRLGLGILFHEYPGHLESASELNFEKEGRLQSGHFSFVRFLLSEESYIKVLRYLAEFHEQKKYHRYGLPHRPRYGEGSGCSAFAASFLEVAGIMEDEFKNNWSGSVRAPEELIGSLEKKGKKVSLFRLLLQNEKNARWAREDEPGKKVFYWDPDMMHEWVLKKSNITADDLGPKYKKIKIKNTLGVEIDRREIKPSEESIWL